MAQVEGVLEEVLFWAKEGQGDEKDSLGRGESEDEGEPEEVPTPALQGNA